MTKQDASMGRRRLQWALLPAIAVLGLLGLASLSRSPRAEASTPPALARPSSAVSPLVDAVEPDEALRDFDGVVRTRLVAGSYLYFEVEADDGARRWVATLKTSDALEADRVEVSSYAARSDFESRRLGRRFERLLFGRVKKAETKG
jgi:hypothetical protein